jgi:hypothetical protein
MIWVKGDDLTIPVSLKKTKCYLLPANEGENYPTVRQIRWNRVSTLAESVKVFIGGSVKMRDRRLHFVSVKEKPLTVIFYNCPDTELTNSIIRSSRSKNEYWNSITPLSVIIGALSLLYIAFSLLYRPAYNLTVITALVSVFIPLLPIIPPGLLFTNFYRRLAWHARKLRTFRELSNLPLKYLETGMESRILNTGEKYGFIKIDSLSPEEMKNIPYLIPETAEEGGDFYCFGILPEEKTQTPPLPKRSKDPFVSFGMLNDKAEVLSRRYAIKAYSVELTAWIILILGIISNVVFIMMISLLFRGFTF